MIDAITIGLSSALIGVVYAYVLPDNPTPLFWWYDLLAWMAEKPVLKWLAYPLGYCEKCSAGQLGLWWSVHDHGWTMQAPATAALSVISAMLIVKWIK